MIYKVLTERNALRGACIIPGMPLRTALRRRGTTDAILPHREELCRARLSLPDGTVPKPLNAAAEPGRAGVPALSPALPHRARASRIQPPREAEDSELRRLRAGTFQRRQGTALQRKRPRGSTRGPGEPCPARQGGASSRAGPKG